MKGLTVCALCIHTDPKSLMDPALCDATKVQKGIDFVTGEPVYRGEAICRDRNRKGHCRYFEATAKEGKP